MLAVPVTPSPASAPPAFNDAERLIQGVFEPPEGPMLTALARNKRLVAACAVLLAILGIAYGSSRQATYTTSATLQIGEVNPNSPGFFGYVQSAASLATAFSRAVYAEPVLAQVQRQLALPPATAAARLSAAPIPTSPAFRVIATGPTQRAAVQLANVASQAVIAYEAQSNSTNPQAESLLSEYRAASLALRQAVAKVSEESKRSHRLSSTLADAEAARTAASAKLRAIGVAYTDAITSRGPSSGLVSLVAGALGASNDRHAKIEKFGFLGLLAGLAVGCALAISLEQRRHRRLAVGAPAREAQSPERV
jgi:uncharacterized protein involved in exopolysaccharide biosynthesis